MPDPATPPVHPKRGEVWLINVNPSTPKDPHLPRPVIVISTDNRNKTWDSVIVVPLSTGLSNPNAKFHIEIKSGAAGLDRDTFARCDLVSNIEESCLDKTKGALGPELLEKYMWEVIRGVRRVIGDNPDL
jgi:mRNA interferase MazF